jgi:hypothetical protein
MKGDIYEGLQDKKVDAVPPPKTAGWIGGYGDTELLPLTHSLEDIEDQGFAVS